MTDTQHQKPGRFNGFRNALRGRKALSVELAVLLVSLAAVVYFAQAYRAENRALLAELDLVAQQSGQPIEGPEDIIRVAHSVCVLNTNISSMQSFIQPTSTTVTKGGWCGNYTRVFIAYARHLGYPAQKIHLRTGYKSHTNAEIYYQGQWRAGDPFFGLVFPKANGELATVSEIAADPDLAQGKLVLDAQDPELASIYESYQRIFGKLYRDALNFQWEVSGSVFFHDAVILLSYPNSLITEGPRRPIIPYWLDRPNLLGVYLASAVMLVTLSLLAWGQWAARRHAEAPEQNLAGLRIGHIRPS